ncbi:ribonucleoside reductase class II [Candidatus Daviesbacteria bacterium]|nr:ribonucleoside reductase class II [Candidatus Daviesbacteria bacterium]
MPPLPTNSSQPSFSESSEKILKERYLLKGGNLETVETIAERFWHVAYDVASADFDFGATKKQVLNKALDFYKMMVQQEFLPNSPTIMNAGKQNGLQYSACFVLPVEDDLGGIFDSIKYAALIHQTGGGTGFAFSRLRPNGSRVKTTGGVASGPVSFLRVFNAATESIKQGGTRRGANMGILRIDHPDVLEFIRSKSDLDENNAPVYEEISQFLPEDSIRAHFKRLLLDRQISNFNISCAVTDKFMDAYAKGEDYDLIDPHNGEAVGKLNAKAVFDEIIDRAWDCADPGLIFIDRINNSPANPMKGVEEIESTNPCVTGKTWVHTSEGPKQVHDLIGKPFLARVNGTDHLSSLEGFFKTGNKNLLKLQTIEGYSLQLTADHLVRKVNVDTKRMEWIKAGELKSGDYIEINNHRINTAWSGKYTNQEGYLIGLLVGDGTLKSDKAVLSVWGGHNLPNLIPIAGVQSVMQVALDSSYTLPHRSDFLGWMALPSRNEHRLALGHIKNLALELGMLPGKKTITEGVEKASSDFYKGFLRGLFDADGSVQGYEGGRTSVRLAQSNLSFLEAVQRMLLRLGIFSHIYKNRRKAGKKLLPDGKGGYKDYTIKAQHELSITKDNILVFDELIGFSNSKKAKKLSQKIIAHNKRNFYKQEFIARVESINFEAKKEVYDVKIPGINYYDSNGIISHNCGEQPLAPWDACNLGSINLGKFVKDGQIDWEGLRKVTHQAVEFLDDVVQTNPYTLPQIYDEVHSNRRIGLGVMGWADMLFKMKVVYDSEEALELGEKVMKFINEEGHNKSLELAKKRGPFPNWPRSIYSDTADGSSFKSRPKSSAFKTNQPLRNSTVTTIAPTGTISIIGDCSSGIEPVFALAYIHRAKGDGGKTGNEMRYLTIANKTFTEIAKNEGFHSEDLASKVMDHGSVSGIEEVPTDWQKVFITAPEISPQWHVKMQSAFQKYTDNGVSKTINLPNSATRDDVAAAYLAAWETGCNGITVYRDGSKTTQVLNVSKTLQPKTNGLVQEEVTELSQDSIVSRPLILRGRTYKIQTPVGEGFITINRDEKDEPFEVFINIGKGGMHTMADAEAIGRLVSLSLRISRSGKNTPRQIAEKIIAQLRGIGGGSHVGFGKNRVMSLADAIAKALSEDLANSKKEESAEVVPLNLTEDQQPAPETTTGRDDVAASNLSLPLNKTADLCPECGEVTLVREDGCEKCYSCGFSKC